MGQYYDIRLSKHMLINGSNYNQSEHVLPELLVLDLAIDNTRCRRLILDVLQHVERLDVWN